MKMEHNHLPVPRTRLPLTETALCAWVGHASPGDKLAYHQGFLAIDTGPDSAVPQPDRQLLQRMASRTRQLAEEGLVHLLQRRDGPCEYTYFIVARSRPRAAGGALKAVLEQAGLSDLRRQA